MAYKGLSERRHPTAVHQLRDLGTERSLFVSSVVYTEMVATRGPAPSLNILRLTKTAFAWELPLEAWDLARNPSNDLPLAVPTALERWRSLAFENLSQSRQLGPHTLGVAL